MMLTHTPRVRPARNPLPVEGRAAPSTIWRPTWGSSSTKKRSAPGVLAKTATTSTELQEDKDVPKKSHQPRRTSTAHQEDTMQKNFPSTLVASTIWRPTWGYNFNNVRKRKRRSMHQRHQVVRKTKERQGDIDLHRGSRVLCHQRRRPPSTMKAIVREAPATTTIRQGVSSSTKMKTRQEEPATTVVTHLTTNEDRAGSASHRQPQEH